MKSSAPWSVKGIERDARETAKEAAKREGMTVGEWLNQIIYTAGAPGESDGEIEGLKLRDIVTAVEHLNKRIAEADAKNVDAVADLSRNVGGIVERVQRLERVKPAEGSPGDLAARLEKLEQAGGDRQRIEALKALEKAVAQVATQFNTAHKSSVERLETNERQLQELAARIDNAGAGDDDASGVNFLKDAIDGLAARIARAERIAGEAAALKEQASGSIDPAFVERTGERLRVLGDEIKRGGDQIRGLEGTIAKLSSQIDAAERRSAEGVHKISETVSGLSAQLNTSQEADERITALQSSFDDVKARLDAMSSEPVAENTAFIDDEDEEPLQAIDGDEVDDALNNDDEIGAETDASLLDDGAAKPEAEESEEPFAFADDIEAAIEETAENGDDFSFELGNGDPQEEEKPEEEESAGVAKSLLSEVQEVFRNRSAEEKSQPEEEAAPEEVPVADEPASAAPDDDLDSILADLENKSEDPFSIGLEDAPKALEDTEASADNERAAAKALLFGEPPSITKEASSEETAADDDEDDAEPKEDFLQAARRRAKEAAAQAAMDKPTRRKLTPKQKAILAARARQKRLAAQNEGSSQVEDKDTSLAQEPVSAPTQHKTEALEQPEEEESRSPFAKIASSVSAMRDNLPFIGKKASDDAPENAEDKSAAGDKEDNNDLDGDQAAFATLKATATARPVTLALGVAIFLAAAALFFLVKDLIFKSPDASERAPAVTVSNDALPADTGESANAGVTLEVPQAAAIDPRGLYTESMGALNAAASDEETAAAVNSLEQAAALGHPPAQLQLGEFYKTGQGVEQDLGQARTWFRRAANGGNVLAMHRIGVMTARGEGGPADTGEAIGWFELAANRGLVDSQYNLGAIFHPSDNGSATVQDAGKAYYWYSLAAKNGDGQATPLAAGVANALTATELSEIDAQIASWEAQPVDDVANEMAQTN